MMDAYRERLIEVAFKLSELHESSYVGGSLLDIQTGIAQQFTPRRHRFRRKRHFTDCWRIRADWYAPAILRSHQPSRLGNSSMYGA